MFFHFIQQLDLRGISLKARWPCNGQCAGLWIELSGFEPWPGHCVVFLGKTLNSHFASPHHGV